MRVEPEQLLDEVPARLVVPELDVADVWERGRQRRRARRTGLVALAVGVTVLATVGLSGVLVRSGPVQPMVGEGPTPSGDATGPHPVAVIDHDGRRITWREGCPVPPEVVLLPGDPAPVDIDGDGDPDLPGAASCEYPSVGTVEIPAGALADELEELRDKLVARRGDLLARLDALNEDPVEPDSHEAQVAQELERTLLRIEAQIDELNARLRRLAERAGSTPSPG